MVGHQRIERRRFGRLRQQIDAKCIEVDNLVEPLLAQLVAP
jgi:hypothetical protein